jgi:predicted metal-binding protein
MSTKVHDEDDETFDEVDVILENAKAGLQMKRSLERKTRRNINLSDIPENFAHVPASSRRSQELIPSRSPTQAKTPSPQVQVGGNRARYKAQQGSLLQSTLRWFRDRYMGCVSAMDGTCDMCGTCNVVTSVHVPSRRGSRQRQP